MPSARVRFPGPRHRSSVANASGFRPASDYADFVVASVIGTYHTLSINDDGTVFWFKGNGDISYMSLEGVSFLAGN